MIRTAEEYQGWIWDDTAEAVERTQGGAGVSAALVDMDTMTLLTAWGRLLRLPEHPDRETYLASVQGALDTRGADEVGMALGGAFDAHAWQETLRDAVNRMADRVNNPGGDEDEIMGELFESLDEIQCAMFAAGKMGVAEEILLRMEQEIRPVQTALEGAADLFQDQVDWIDGFWQLFRQDLLQTEPGLFAASRHFRCVLRALCRM